MNEDEFLITSLETAFALRMAIITRFHSIWANRRQ